MYASPRSRRHECVGVRAVHALAPLRASNLRAKALAVTLPAARPLAIAPALVHLGLPLAADAWLD